jgi:hypothetical protein
MLAAGIPALTGVLAWRRALGAHRADAVWLGVLAYFAYNCVLFLFATPFNEIFLLYTTMFGLSLAALIAVCQQTEAPPRLLATSPRNTRLVAVSLERSPSRTRSSGCEI